MIWFFFRVGADEWQSVVCDARRDLRFRCRRRVPQFLVESFAQKQMALSSARPG